MLPLLARAAEKSRARTYTPEELAPFHSATLESAPRAGLPLLSSVNDVDLMAGIAPYTVNIVDGARWNAGFAYLDDHRNSERLTICSQATVDRLILERGVARGAHVIRDRRWTTIHAQTTVLAAGAYGSPAILERSGVGNPEHLRALGISVDTALRGVGENLHDHPIVVVRFEGSALLRDQTSTFARSNFAPEEQTLALLPSSHAEAGTYDLHIVPWSHDGYFTYSACLLTPRSRGSVHVIDADPRLAPRIDLRYVSDPQDHDLRVLMEGVSRISEIVGEPQLARLLGKRVPPDDGALANWVTANIESYAHPAGSCAMGTADDPVAVVDGGLAVHGVADLYVSDCSVMSVLPRAATHLPALVVGARCADSILAS